MAIGFVCLFSNSLLLGLPITERAYGPDALAGNYAIISIHAPMFYAFGITLMEIVRHHGHGPFGRAPSRGKALRAIFSNALVLGITAGFVGQPHRTCPCPARSSTAVDLLARAAIPAALFGLGGVLTRYRPEGDLLDHRLWSARSR